MQSTSGKRSVRNSPLTPIADALPPPEAASRFTVQQPLSARARELPVGPEDQVGPEDELHAHRERAIFVAEINRLNGVIAQADEYLAEGDTGSTLSMAAEQISALRANSAVDVLRWQGMLQELDGRNARDATLHEHKSPPAHALARTVAAVLVEPDAKAQRRLDKKARQALKQPAGPADRVRQAEVSGKPEVTLLVNFIADHFEGRLLPLTDDAWRVIPNWVGFRNLNTNAQTLARDFSALTADERDASAVMRMLHDKRHVLRPAALPRKPEQKDPGPVPQGMASAPKAVVVHAAEVKSEKLAPAEVEQSEEHESTPLERFQRYELGKPVEANALADFIFRNTEKNASKNRSLAEIKDWPGYLQLDRHGKKLADCYGKLAQEDRAKTLVHRRVLQLLSRNDAPSKVVPHVAPAVALSIHLSLKQDEERSLQNGGVKLSQELSSHAADMTPADTVAVQRFLSASEQQKATSLPALKKLPAFHKLKPLQKRAVELRVENGMNQFLLQQVRDQMDPLLQQVPEQEQLLARLDDEFADALMKSPGAATAMKDFLRMNRAPDDAEGQLHTTLPGAAALPPDVKVLLQLADQLTAQARLCGCLLQAIKKRDALHPGERPIAVAQARPDAAPQRYLLRREVLLNNEVAREKAAYTAFSVRLQETEQPGAIAELDELVKAQPAPPELRALRYARLNGFAKLGRAAQLLGRLRDDNITARLELDHILTTSQTFLLRLLG
jgi:hypothetical protein